MFELFSKVRCIFSLNSLSVYIFIFGALIFAQPNIASADRRACAPNDLSAATESLIAAKTAMQKVLVGLEKGGDHTGRLLVKWFGNDETETSEQVKNIIVKTHTWANTASFFCIYENDGTLMEHIATPTGYISVDVSNEVFAYVDPTKIGEVTLGLAFFRAPNSGLDSKMGSVIHELTHFWLTANTDDVEYGIAHCLKLAKDHPELALKNADNIQYFIEDWITNASNGSPVAL